MVPAFYLVVDGQIRFGPYLSRNESHLNSLLSLKGITTLPVIVKRRELWKAKQRIDLGDEQPGLLDGVPWLPITKMDPEGWKEEE